MLSIHPIAVNCKVECIIIKTTFNVENKIWYSDYFGWNLCGSRVQFIYFCYHDVDKTAKHNDKIEHIPRITEIILKKKKRVENIKETAKNSRIWHYGLMYTLKRNAASLNTNSIAKTIVNTKLSVSNISVYSLLCP